ncbi:Heat induced stress protein YflT [Terribacillus halophilus]|uniref:Heat induced stress protein YflT n=1 Tax=Terribacillus halophilus TaxID=361279 RepID=A0A1G6UBY1_9BACI|nr:general stress protein [Terribacillus halophilus]SDD38095.1 Heat induced stress protein YflT [Terribacillus halophilus]
MANTTTIELFLNESDAKVKVNELISSGVPEQDIMIIVDKKPADSILGDKRDVHYREANGSFGAKLASFFSSEDPEEKVLKNLGLSEAEKESYADELKAGKVLLYAKNAPATRTHPRPAAAKDRTEQATEAEKGMTADGLYAADKPNDGLHAEPNTKDQKANEWNKTSR